MSSGLLADNNDTSDVFEVASIGDVLRTTKAPLSDTHSHQMGRFHPAKKLIRSQSIDKNCHAYERLTASDILFREDVDRDVPSDHLDGGVLLRVRETFKPAGILRGINKKKFKEARSITNQKSSQHHATTLVCSSIYKRLNFERRVSLSRQPKKATPLQEARITILMRNGRSRQEPTANRTQKGPAKGREAKARELNPPSSSIMPAAQPLAALLSPRQSVPRREILSYASSSGEDRVGTVPILQQKRQTKRRGIRVPLADINVFGSENGSRGRRCHHGCIVKLAN